MEDGKAREIARLIRDSSRIVIFTGAGISTESGIPDFRSPGGIWSQYNSDDLTYQRFRSHEKYRRLYWEYDRARFPAMRDALPNAAHLAIATIEKTGRMAALITQNIDGLHQKAGSSPEKIYELHGTVWEVSCLDCGRRWPREEVTDRMDREAIDVPYCDDCRGPLKCATIAFGQSLPADVLEQSFFHARSCDLFITIGSSLVVHPAAMLPVEAKQAGARLALINMSATPYDRLMDVIIMGMAGPTMDAVMGEYGKLSAPGPD